MEGQPNLPTQVVASKVIMAMMMMTITKMLFMKKMKTMTILFMKTMRRRWREASLPPPGPSRQTPARSNMQLRNSGQYHHNCYHNNYNHHHHREANSCWCGTLPWLAITGETFDKVFDKGGTKGEIICRKNFRHSSPHKPLQKWKLSGNIFD